MSDDQVETSAPEPRPAPKAQKGGVYHGPDDKPAGHYIELRSENPDNETCLHLVDKDWEAAGRPDSIEQFHAQRKRPAPPPLEPTEPAPELEAPAPSMRAPEDRKTSKRRH